MPKVHVQVQNSAFSGAKLRSNSRTHGPGPGRPNPGILRGVTEDGGGRCSWKTKAD